MYIGADKVKRRVRQAVSSGGRLRRPPETGSGVGVALDEEIEVFSVCILKRQRGCTATMRWAAVRVLTRPCLHRTQGNEATARVYGDNEMGGSEGVDASVFTPDTGQPEPEHPSSGLR
jgi:hypothetical protein